MAYTLECSRPTPISLREFRERTHTLSFETPEQVCEAAEAFACLNANKGLLVAFINERLKQWRAGKMDTGYTGQIFLLADYGNYYIRANIWLPLDYETLPAASSSDQFFYELPHDHNFTFLTAGHFGGGYRTKIYEYDGAARAVGAKIDPTFLEDTSLPEGKLMVYRASRDVHVQHPPKAFSVSLNIMTRNAHEFARRQCIFDRECETLLRHATSGVDPVKSAFFRTAALVGDTRTESLLEDLARSSDTPMTRVAAAALDLRRNPEAAGGGSLRG